MAWRSMIGSIVAEALRAVTGCAKSGDAETCARRLIASADAIYAPLKPVDSGLGEARRVASLLAGIVANAFLAAAREREDSDSFLHGVLEVLERLKNEPPPEEAGELLAAAGAAAFQPAVSREARESIVGDVRAYVEPPQPQVPRRRRRQPRRPEPAQSLRRALRELGRRDPILAKQISQLLRSQGLI